MLLQGWLKRTVFIAVALVPIFSSSAALKVELLVGGLSRPVFICSPPGDSNRLFIVEQHVSRIRVFDRTSGSLLPTAFLTITGVRRDSEQGLLGLAFHPGFATNGYFYININPSGGTNRTEIQRYQVQGDPMSTNVADATSRTLILTYTQPFNNHNGGWIGFGPDGYLYIASGDGGSGNDPQNNAQNRSSLLGKILRIDVDGAEPYAIPEGNPFKEHMTYANEIWAFGLRNPWRCSFDRETGNLWIGDVGQGAREEIDVNPAGVGGLNFGWRPREGMIATPNINETPVTSATNPVFDYDRSLGYSVTGGYVYRGAAVPELRGKYIFADYGSARFWATDLNETGTNGVTTQITTDINPNRTAVNSISSFGEDAAGELYVCDLDGQVFRILAEGPVPPQVAEVNRDGDDFVFSFQARATQAYVVEESVLLGQGSNWIEVETFAASQTDRSITVTNSTAGDALFFRIRTE